MAATPVDEMNGRLFVKTRCKLNKTLFQKVCKSKLHQTLTSCFAFTMPAEEYKVTDPQVQDSAGLAATSMKNCKGLPGPKVVPATMQPYGFKGVEPTLPAPMLALANTPLGETLENCLSSWATECTNHIPKIFFFF